MQFEFGTAARIIFGPGTLAGIGPIVRGFGQRALVVHGSTPARARGLLEALSTEGLKHTCFSVQGEPTIEQLGEGLERGREFEAEVVVGFGGGSVIDASKAIAGLSTNSGAVLDFLEVIGKGKPLARPALPCIAVPTTAGTGAEVTRNAVLASPEHRLKVSLRSTFLVPRVALVDPELTYDLPKMVTAFTGLDALTQLIEPFVSKRANPMTDAICREGLSRVAGSLQRVFERGDDPAGRYDMSLVSLFGGLALANSTLGAVHGFAGPLGGMFPAPHGAICAALLPHVMKINVRALLERAPDSPVLPRYGEIASILTGAHDAAARDGIDWVTRVCTALQVRGLRTYGVTENDIPVLVEKATQASSTKGNPIALTTAEMTEALSQAL
ncbi:MAG: iron-containing alcohol dehydrogenase [Chthoniobacterales bacterium]